MYQNQTRQRRSDVPQISLGMTNAHVAANAVENESNTDAVQSSLSKAYDGRHSIRLLELMNDWKEKHRKTLGSTPIAKATYMMDILNAVADSADDFGVSLENVLHPSLVKEHKFEKYLDFALVDMEKLSKSLGELKSNQAPVTVEKTASVVITIVSAVMAIIGSVTTYVGGNLDDNSKQITSAVGLVLVLIAFGVVVFNNLWKYDRDQRIAASAETDVEVEIKFLLNMKHALQNMKSRKPRLRISARSGASSSSGFGSGSGSGSVRESDL